MRILATGSEGNLMQWVINDLIELGHDVVGVDIVEQEELEDYQRRVPIGEYEFHQADLTDEQVVNDLVSGVDGIINAAASLYGVKGFHKYPADIMSNDLVLHRNILEAAKRHDIDRVVYISSSMVYECSEPPHKEEDFNDLITPKTDYGLSKVVGERLSMAFEEQYGIDYTIWRPFNVFVPHEKSEIYGESHVFADFLKKILIEQQNPMDIFGSGEQVRAFTWVGDVARGIANYSFDDRTANEAYNLANTDPITMKELANNIFDIGKDLGIIEGEDVLEFNTTRPPKDDVKTRIPSADKAKEHLGWEAVVPLDESLQTCVEYLPEMYDVDIDIQ